MSGSIFIYLSGCVFLGGGIGLFQHDMRYIKIGMPRLIALICKKPSISEEDFKSYYESNHAPLIESLFPTLTGYKRTYLLKSNMLNDTLPLESDGVPSQYNVITELTFDDEEGLYQFFELGKNEDVIEAIRNDEANFLDGEQTIMYRVD